MASRAPLEYNGDEFGSGTARGGGGSRGGAGGALSLAQQRMLYCTLQRPACAPALASHEIEADIALIANRKRRRGNTRTGAASAVYDALPAFTRLCAAVLLQLRHAEGGAFFNGPAESAGWPAEALRDYYEGDCKANDALDLSIVQQRLSAGDYASPAPFVNDVRGVLRDAAYCGPEGSALRVRALALWEAFEKAVEEHELADKAEVKPELVIRVAAEPEAPSPAKASKAAAAAAAALTTAALAQADAAAVAGANGDGSAAGTVVGASVCVPTGAPAPGAAAAAPMAPGLASSTRCQLCDRVFKSPQALAGHRHHCMR